MAFDSTPSGPEANSYVTVEAADAYFENRLDAAVWTNITDTAIKEKALMSATLRLEQEQWDFYPTTQSQALAWPRTGVVTPDGVSLSPYEVPRNVQYATFELALAMLSSTSLGETGLNRFKSLSVAGVISIVPREFYEGDLPTNVYRWLEGYMLSSAGTIHLIRS